MNRECYIEGEDIVHVFDVGHGEPDDLACACGEVTWGQMNQLLLLTQMWDATP